MTDEKRRPMAERIAGLDVKTSFRDIRDGVGGTSGAKLTDQDLAAAMGMVKTRRGSTVVLALETYYGSTLRHEQALRAKWADHSEHNTDVAGERIRNRFSAAIAIRQFAGIRHAQSDMAEYSYLMFQRPKDFEKRVSDVLAWLEDMRATGLSELRKCLAESRAVA
jgi:hypothetical protein